MLETEEDPKYTFKRLEPSIGRFIKILEIDLERLHQHRVNIDKFKQSRDYDALDKEQINASRTCQQLKSNIRQLEITRSHLEDDDLKRFDLRVSQIRMEAFTSFMDFSAHYGNLDTDLRVDLKSDPEHEASSESVPLEQLQLHVDSKPGNSRVEQSMNDLQEVQQKEIDQIEENVVTASENIDQGTTYLAKAAKLKHAMYPLAGAALGTAIGGPVGLLVGLKIGAAAAVGGSIAGFTGGSYLKNRQKASVEADENKRQEEKEEERSASPVSSVEKFGDT